MTSISSSVVKLSVTDRSFIRKNSHHLTFPSRRCQSKSEEPPGCLPHLNFRFVCGPLLLRPSKKSANSPASLKHKPLHGRSLDFSRAALKVYCTKRQQGVN